MHPLLAILIFTAAAVQGRYRAQKSPGRVVRPHSSLPGTHLTARIQGWSAEKHPLMRAGGQPGLELLGDRGSERALLASETATL